MISQYAKDRPDPRVDAWMQTVDNRAVYLSVITLAELAQGVELLTPGAKRRRLERWLEEDLVNQFFGRTLPFDEGTVRYFGRLMARAKREGFAPGAMNGLIAATAVAKGMVVATLNRKDFERLGVELVEW